MRRKEMSSDYRHTGKDDIQTSRLDQLIKWFLGLKAALTWATFRRRHAYDIIYSDTEAIGLPLRTTLVSILWIILILLRSWVVMGDVLPIPWPGCLRPTLYSCYPQ